MNNYNKINNITGWFVFLIAAFVYISTIEPTASFWDCGEFIATSYKLEVGHQPGAPLFLIMTKVFSYFLSGGDVHKVAPLVNTFSALMSAFSILFLFWTITAFARKIVIKKGSEPTNDNILAVMGAGAIGALAYTFTDSFWFSAVEGEVYASSAFFTAIVFWCIMKWDAAADDKYAVRWIIMIAFLMGLSIGVHLLNLLTIPALAYVYYFRKYKVSRNGILVASVVGVLLLAFVQFGIIPGVVKLAAFFDLMFVNSFHMGFGSGVIFYAILGTAAVVWGLYYTKKKDLPLVNTAILCVVFIIIGYSSFAQIVVRSDAGTPLNEGDPEDVFSLQSYLGREQYGDFPLFQGQYYNAKYIDTKEGSDIYIKDAKNNVYKSIGKKQTPVYDPEYCTIFPRMYDSEGNHVRGYKEWAGIKGDRKPTFGENMTYFFKYQVNFMYWRYFFWNFVGRQNDIQGYGEINHGNWISGIPFIDAMMVGPQDKLPQSQLNNKGRNKFYFLPMILGIIGIVYHYKKNWHDGLIVTMFFFFTGLAIILYLNQPPYQPRERDYAYAGSFYVYAIFIGLGVLWVIDMLRKYLDGFKAGIAAILICAIVPGVLAKDGWDDHDRSHRYTARDFAYDYLNSCAPNAILFTGGDNDTFPLWYEQEVEGVRTDVRVIVSSLYNTDWYINTSRQKFYDSDPLPYSIPPEKYTQGTRDYLPFYDKKIKENIPIKDFIAFIASDKPEAKVRMQNGNEMNYFPTKKLRLPVDSATVVNNGTVAKEDADKIVPFIDFEFKDNYLMKGHMMALDMLATNNWKRPVYFAVSMENSDYLGLEDYFQLEGLAYRLVPIKHTKSIDGQAGGVNTKIMYKNLMSVFKWGGMETGQPYLDDKIRNMTINLRNNFERLADALLSEGKKEMAIAVLDKCQEVIPEKVVPYDVYMIRAAEIYYRAGAIAQANKLVKRLDEIYQNDLAYYMTLKGSDAKAYERETNQAGAVVNELARMAKEAKQDSLSTQIQKGL